MRKVILIAGVACLMAAIGASSAVASPSTWQRFEAKVIGKAGTAKKPGSVGSYLHPFHIIKQDASCATAANSAACRTNTFGPASVAGGALEEPPFATMQAYIYFPKEMKLATAGFPTCELATAVADPKTCPKGSVIGGGVAAGYARNATAGVGQYTLRPNLTVDVVILSPTQLGLRTYNPLTGKGLITGDIGKATGAAAKKYGTKITFSIPKGLINPSGILMSQLSSFDSTIKAVKNKKGKPLQALTGCPKNKKLTFGYNGIYNVMLDRDTQPTFTAGDLTLSINHVGPIVTSTVPCKK